MNKAIREHGWMVLAAAGATIIGLLYEKPAFLLSASILLGFFVAAAIRRERNGK